MRKKLWNPNFIAKSNVYIAPLFMKTSSSWWIEVLSMHQTQQDRNTLQFVWDQATQFHKICIWSETAAFFSQLRLLMMHE